MSTDLPANSIVIIGAGLAGWHVIDAIRAKDKDVPITLITSDNGDRYHKPMLTVAISQNKRVADLVRASGEEAAKAADITLLANTSVTDIEPEKKQLQLVSSLRSDPVYTNYATLSYEKLVLAMGARPIFPKSLPEELVWHVNHIERFGELQEQLQGEAQRVAIVGAGMVGTEIAEDLLKAGHSVTLMDINTAPLAQMLPEPATARIANAIKSQGIEFLGGAQVMDVVKQDDGTLEVSYQLGDEAKSFIADHVIASTGLTVDKLLPTAANIDFDTRTGIKVDAPTLRTTTRDIYAIGDCMSINGVPCRYVAPLRAQAATIADDILGLEHSGYEHKPPMIRLKNKAISVMATGIPTASGNWQVKTETDDELVMELLDNDGKIQANVTIKAPVLA